MGIMDDLAKSYVYKRNKYLKDIERYIGKDIIKVIVGIRRSGKSVLMRQVISYLKKERNVREGQILYIDKESLAFDFLKNYMDLYNYVKERHPKYIFIDEVQEILGWEKAIASLHKEGVDVYVTGSNARMLSSDLATYLAGRYISFHVHPLSFEEFVEFHGRTEEGKAKIFEDYLELGGFPVLLQFKGDAMASYGLIGDIFETIILKDIVARHNIRGVHLLQNIIRYVVDNIANTFSANKVSEYLKSQQTKMSPETVHDYLEFLIETYALYRVRRYDVQGKRHLEISEKFYLGDLGLRHALIGYRRNDIGQYLENIVYLELLRRGYTVSVGRIGNREIDFIAEKRGEKEYIQVCYLLATEEVRKREYGVLHAVQDSFPKLVLSMDAESTGTYEGIRHHNIVNWLLE